MIKDNIAEVKSNIETAKKNSKYKQEVTLICVSKTKPLEMVKEAYSCGELHFGENKVQEIVEKAPAMSEDVVWHMIGHLQKNKVKKAVLYSSIIHSVDSLELAECINKDALKINKIQDILIELNIASEDSKFGLDKSKVIDLISKLSSYKNIKVRGLMCVAPFTDVPENNREYFKTMHNLLEEINSLNIDNVKLDILSMGMSGDYMIAIEEGATHVRVGTNIFGARNYNI